MNAGAYRVEHAVVSRADEQRSQMRQRTAKSVVIHDARQIYATAGYANPTLLP